jgi:anti-sigma regulatory factor (Ser/Thr protein kinase)
MVLVTYRDREGISPEGGDAVFRMATEVFAGKPASVPEMRRWLYRELAGHPAGDEAILLADELAANAVRHTEGDYSVLVRWDEESVVITVADEGATEGRPTFLPCPRPHADIDEFADPAESGRGLLLVRALSSRWGITETERGFEVWFEVTAAGAVGGMPGHPVECAG